MTRVCIAAHHYLTTIRLEFERAMRLKMDHNGFSQKVLLLYKFGQ